jgi:hypothetical protein
MRYRGAAVEAKVEKNERRNRPPTKVGIVLAVLVTTVPSIESISKYLLKFSAYSPTTTPQVPIKIERRRPLQSATQINNAPAICPI